MVANLIVNQQAMATLFNARGDRHSGSLDHHHTTLTALGRFQDRCEANINILVDECRVLCTQVESLGDNMCRWAQEQTSIQRSVLLSLSLGVENAVVVGTGKTPWSMLMSTLRGLTTVTNWHFSCLFLLIFSTLTIIIILVLILSKQPTLVQNHFVCSLCSQITEKCVY